MQNQWVADISGQESKAAVLPELLGAFPTKAVNDTALKESISLCSIHWQRMDSKDETHTQTTSICFQNLLMKPSQIR